MHSSWVVKRSFGVVFKIFVTFFLILAISLTAITIWVNSELGPPSDAEEKKVFVIKKGETAASFAVRLKNENLIKNPLIFRAYLKLSGLDKKIQAGSFNLTSNLSAEEIALILTEGRFDKWVTIKEGLRKEEVVEILVKEFDIEKEKFLKVAKEGYLFPDTYLASVDINTEQIMTILKKNFEKKVTQDIVKKAEKIGLTKNKLIIFASIVEREARKENERPVIAGILIKRWQEGIALGADATTQYALGYSNEEKTWWRKTITVDDLEMDSPFNTRKNVGLPPGPICSPGLAAIEAIADPTNSPYYYYLHDDKGKVHYAKTYGEHLSNKAKFLQ
jgi:UPF0755 protein